MVDVARSTSLPRRVDIVEVGPRDGLQNEQAVLDTEAKIAFIGRAVAAGARRIEVASFVNPARVPQMADAEAVLAGLPPRRRRDLHRPGAQPARHGEGGGHRASRR